MSKHDPEPENDSPPPRSKARKKEKDTTDEVVGGFAFFLSLLALLPTGILFFGLALFQVRDADIKIAGTFIISIVFGAVLTQGMIRGHFSVLLHEFKHSLISNLVGNKRKGMRIDERSGHFEYAYTKKTAHFNAFISLAPYIVPIFTFVAVLMAFATCSNDPVLAAVVIGLGYGADLLLNARDISPVQTDITLIRGGYGIGLLYIAAWNLIIASVVLAWAFQGPAGIVELFATISKAFIHIYFFISGHSPGA